MRLFEQRLTAPQQRRQTRVQVTPACPAAAVATERVQRQRSRVQHGGGIRKVPQPSFSTLSGTVEWRHKFRRPTPSTASSDGHAWNRGGRGKPIKSIKSIKYQIRPYRRKNSPNRHQHLMDFDGVLPPLLWRCSGSAEFVVMLGLPGPEPRQRHESIKSSKRPRKQLQNCSRYAVCCI